MKEILIYLKNSKVIALQILNIIFSIVANAGTLLVPYFLGFLIDSYEQGQGLNLSPILPLVIISTIAMLFAELVNDFLNNYISYYVGYNIKNDLMKKIVNQEWSFVNKLKKDNLFNIMNNDVTVIKDFLSNGLVAIVNGALLLIGSIFLMMRINVRLTIYVIIIMPFVWLAFVLFFSRSRRYFMAFRKIIDELSQRIDETIQGAMLVRVFNSQRQEIDKFRNVNEGLFSNSLKVLKMFAIMLPMVSFINYVMYLVVLNLGGPMAISGEISIGDITQFVYYTTMFTAPLLIIGFISTAIGSAIESSKRIEKVINAKSKFIDGQVMLENFESLKFDSVYFKFEDEENADYIIENVSFKISKGEKIGILGPTGSGKSLLLSLLLRLYDPTEGNVLLNEKDLKDYKIDSYRKTVGFVPQENFLLNTTITENIAFGEKVDMEKLKKICKICMVDDFVSSLPNKYDEMVGERGTNLSGGQKQRITLARALYQDAQILVLDDSTSKLDIVTEKKIIKNIQEEFNNLTIIIVAQKIVSIKDCDQIVLLDQGRLEGFGSHKELDRKSFLYKQIELSQK